MVIIDQLRLSDDASRLYLTAHVNSAVDRDGNKIFQNIYIDKIVIMSSDKVMETDPMVPIYDKHGEPTDYLYYKKIDGNTKYIDIVLTSADFENLKQADMGKTLFFVYIVCKGTVGECVPCRLQELTTLGVTFDEKMLYQKVMGYTKSLNDDCNIPEGFADFILLWNAFKASVETEHYIPAIKYWKMMFDADRGNLGYSDRRCGCHG